MDKHSNENKVDVFIDSLSSILFDTLTNKEIEVDNLIDYWGGELPHGFRPWEEDVC